MRFGSCQELASFLLDAGPPGVLFTRNASRPSRKKKDVVPAMLAGE
jgi:hypothetical protein